MIGSSQFSWGLGSEILHIPYHITLIKVSHRDSSDSRDEWVDSTLWEQNLWNQILKRWKEGAV